MQPRVRNYGFKNGDEIDYSKIEKPKVEESDAFEYYTIAKGDTYFNLFKRFGFEMDTLKNFNPELQQGLKLGMRIRYPKKNENNHEVTDSLKIEGTENLTDITYVNDQEIKNIFLKLHFGYLLNFIKLIPCPKKIYFLQKPI